MARPKKLKPDAPATEVETIVHPADIARKNIPTAETAALMAEEEAGISQYRQGGGGAGGGTPTSTSSNSFWWNKYDLPLSVFLLLAYGYTPEDKSFACLSLAASHVGTFGRNPRVLHVQPWLSILY